MSGTRIGKLKGIWEIYFPVTLVAHLPLTYNGERKRLIPKIFENIFSSPINPSTY